jgi:hypothetical protein
VQHHTDLAAGEVLSDSSAALVVAELTEDHFGLRSFLRVVENWDHSDTNQPRVGTDSLALTLAVIQSALFAVDLEQSVADLHQHPQLADLEPVDSVFDQFDFAQHLDSLLVHQTSHPQILVELEFDRDQSAVEHLCSVQSLLSPSGFLIC